MSSLVVQDGMEGSVKKDVNIVIHHGQKQRIQSVIKSTPSCDK